MLLIVYTYAIKQSSYSLVIMVTKWNYPALSLVVYQGKMGKSVSTERWHYVQWDEGRAGEMLTDLKNDPFELKNLDADPVYGETVRSLKKLLTRIPPEPPKSQATQLKP